MWDNPDTVQSIARVSTWLAVLFGLLAALAGTLAAVAGSRADRLREEQKQLPPVIGVSLVPAGADGVTAIVESQNRVPIEFTLTLVTLHGKVLGGVPMDKQTLQPTKSEPSISIPRNFATADVEDRYVEARLRYQSRYQPDYPTAKLSGYLARAYRYSADGVSLAPCEPATGS